MKRTSVSFGVMAAVLATGGLSLQTAVAQDDGASGEFIEEIVTTGSRSAKPRSAGDSTVPVDVINANDFTAMGNTADLTDNIKALVPSYTATPATGDGSAFVRPTSLRGTAPDQTLVLIDGKRRHRSALVQFLAPAAGNGSHGVDIGMIPSMAIKRVEVLRDGASSQYGSDAIAGVINFITKDDAEGGSAMVQFGEHFDGEQSLRAGFNIGLPIGNSGFVNATLEYNDNDALSRGIQRQVAQDLIDSGVQGVGADSPFGDAPFVQTWGRPQTEGTRFFLNSGFELSGSAEMYAKFGLAQTEGRYRFFYRSPTHSTFTSQRAFGDGCPTCDPNADDPLLDDPLIPNTQSFIEQGWTGLPAGFTPFLDGDQDDASIVVGLRGEFDSGMLYDVSYNYGKNELDYFLNNTANPSLGPGDLTTLPQMGFDVGGYAQEENTINADFSLAMNDQVNVAFGFEVREETFSAFAGEPNSYLGSGSSGFRGVEPKNAGDFKRDNVAIYADIEHDISDALLVQYAARYENFSDFGGTLNGKLAARFRVSDTFALRGAISTGFHAPTPGQSNISTIITTFDGATGLQVEEGLFPVSDPSAQAAGATALKEEESLNISAGFSADIGDYVSLTADIYRIEVDDRIYRTGDIPVPPQPGDDPNLPARSLSFYTNAIDVEHEGIDIVATSSLDIGANTGLELSFAYGYNTIEVTGQTAVSGILPVSASVIEDIENNFPEHRFVLTGNFLIGEDVNVMARINYYGEHYDERGTIAGVCGDVIAGEWETGACGTAAGPIGPVDKSWEIGSTIYVDLEAGWNVNDNWRVVLGGANIFDEFIDTIPSQKLAGTASPVPDEWANRIGVGLPYPRRTAANYEGGSWYLKGIYSFD
ncbi:MAG: TonB-dependent receptor [Woeseiaceae bacterium]|nr:TonB-dependent receptor [Woeseiaceae bacterium]